MRFRGETAPSFLPSFPPLRGTAFLRRLPRHLLFGEGVQTSQIVRLRRVTNRSRMRHSSWGEFELTM